MNINGYDDEVISLNNEMLTSRSSMSGSYIAISTRFLNSIATIDDRFEFCDIVLFRVSTQNILPAVEANDKDRINLRVILKVFKRVNDYRLVVNVYKLLGDVLACALTFARSKQQCNRAHKKFAAKKFAAVHLHKNYSLTFDLAKYSL